MKRNSGTTCLWIPPSSWLMNRCLSKKPPRDWQDPSSARYRSLSIVLYGVIKTIKTTLYDLYQGTIKTEKTCLSAIATNRLTTPPIYDQKLTSPKEMMILQIDMNHHQTPKSSPGAFAPTFTSRDKMACQPPPRESPTAHPRRTSFVVNLTFS